MGEMEESMKVKGAWESMNTADLGKPIFSIESIGKISWWSRCLLYFLPTRHYKGDDNITLYLKFWRGRVYLVEIEEDGDV